jgi:PTS system cellobiose-specific IIC component
MSYLVVNPTTYTATNSDGLSMLVSNVLAKQYTDTKGLFLGMIVAVASVELYTRLAKCDALNFGSILLAVGGCLRHSAP